jgi:chromosome segregation protein
VRLTQIKLSGFKSFVDPTSIHVPGQLVGVVGPNGCGKSNVIDAVRWVLGESRASALRGDSMQDVIFNGSVNRAPLARASVELIFDNSQGRAAGQWSQYAEISVKRVLQRDGESNYYINGTHVRRRDITDMFLGTGLGPRAYAIIEQGMISRVIEAKPEELRVFLEEAAGISKYKERRRETENRLADTRENLARISDIRLELTGQLEKLEAQAEVATRYKEYQADLALKQHLLWYLRRRDAAVERERHSHELAKTTNALEAENAALRHAESQVETARADHYRASDALNAAQGALYQANAEVARLESELRHAEDTRSRLEAQHAERRTQLTSWREQRAELTQALHIWATRAGSAKERVLRTKETLDSQTGHLPQAEETFRAARERLDATRAELLQAENRVQLEQANLAHLERTARSLESRRERAEAERATLAEPDQAELRELEAKLAELAASVREAESECETLQAECARLEEALAHAAEALGALEREHAAVTAQLATLRDIQTAAEDNAPLREWLERHGVAAAPRLWHGLSIEAGWETAVEAALGERLHALELADAGGVAAMLADRPPIKASFFGRGSGEVAAPSQLAPLALKVHAADASLSGALADWLAGFFIAEGIPEAEARERLPAGGVLINRDGDRFTRHTLSLHAPDPVDAGFLARKAEIEATGERSRELGRRLEAAHQAKKQTETDAGQRAAALEDARGRISRAQQARHDAEIESLKSAQAHERYRERLEQLDAEAAEIERETASLEDALAAAQAAVTQAAGDIGAYRERLDAASADHDAAEAALAAQRERVQQADREAQEALYGERECASKITELDNAVRVIDQQIGHAEVELGKITEELAADAIPALRTALESAVEARISAEKTLAEARNAVESAAAALRAVDQARVEAEAKAAPLREKLGELRLKEQAASLSFEQFATQLAEAKADEPRLAAEAERAPRPASLQAEITRLMQAINELGAVNLAAVEELATSKERKGYLDSQASDLEEAVHTLEDAIGRIDRETRELLRETFDTVNRHFATLFPVLFGGGEAKLIMTGEEILDAGVQVMAQPPGKRNTSIHLLSGGEKALTAIALVFSLFQLNPAPFCLLDEVDAPLDDSNTVRFCELVQRMSAQTQFLFISHNKISMEMAEQLVGVTMPESGVSRVVAVDIEEALRIREELAA